MIARRACERTIFTIMLATAAPTSAGAQQRAMPRGELRVDVLGGRSTSVQGAVGIGIPSGNYVRVGLLAGAGSSFGGGETGRAAGRVDVLARFLLDPFRQSRWGFSAGAGVSVRAEQGDRVRPHLVAVVDLEGRRSSSGISPSVQLGLGGGVRGGVGLRWSGRTAR